MPNTGTALTPKGLPYFSASDIGLASPDIQGWFQNLATAADARVSNPVALFHQTLDTLSSATYADPSGNADKVTVACPTDGLLIVGYSGLWKVSAAATIAAAIFVGPTGGTQTQLKLPNPASGGAPTVQEASISPGAATNYGYLHSNRQGLGAILPGATDNTLVTTGLIMTSPSGAFDGGLCYIFPGTADTFDVAVKYKNSAGTLSVKERRLWVWSVEYL